MMTGFVDESNVFNDWYVERREKVALDIGTRILLENEYLLTKTYSNRTSRTGVDNQITQATFQLGKHYSNEWFDSMNF